jgi:hypothetical protein
MALGGPTSRLLAETPAMLATARHFKTARLAFFCAALAGFVIALVLACAPGLHERLHGDAEHEQHVPHECLATIIHSGGCDAAAHAPTLAAVIATLFEVTPLDSSRAAESLFLSFRILEHAPPQRA